MSFRILAAALLATLPLGTSQALAHASLTPAETPAGKTYRAVIGIGHGCNGMTTDTVRVTLPDGFYNAKPMPKPGWSLKVVTGPYAKPFDNHGKTMTEGPREIIWSGGTLDDAFFDEFTLRGTVGADLAPGTRLFFKTEQDCGKDSVVWTDTSGSHDVPNPAPFVTVTAAPMDDHGHGQAHSEAAVTLGDLSIAGGYSRATAPGAPVAGGYLTLTNHGSADDVLLGGQTPIAGQVQIHEMSMQGEVMKMRELPDGLTIPAGQTIELKPGGFHLMLMQLKKPLVEGDIIPLTLEFAKAGKVDVELRVGPRDAKSAGGHNH